MAISFCLILVSYLGRQKELSSRRVVDYASRQRRLRKAIEALDQDNYQDDPHADLKINKKAPKFDESIDQPLCKCRSMFALSYNQGYQCGNVLQVLIRPLQKYLFQSLIVSRIT